MSDSGIDEVELNEQCLSIYKHALRSHINVLRVLAALPRAPQWIEYRIQLASAMLEGATSITAQWRVEEGIDEPIPYDLPG